MTPLPKVNGLEFNEACSIFRRLRVKLQADWSQPGRLLIRIPALIPARDITAPAHTQAVCWRIAAAGCTLKDPWNSRQKAATDFEMLYNEDRLAARQIELPFSLKPGGLAVVAVNLQYQVTKQAGPVLLTNPKWLPSGIVGSAYLRS
jgi:hypothetical protein